MKNLEVTIEVLETKELSSVVGNFGMTSSNSPESVFACCCCCSC